jgi:hypothetical protein
MSLFVFFCSSFFFICTGNAILTAAAAAGGGATAGEAVFFVFFSPPPLKLANMFENTKVCALFVAGAFVATFPLEFTICFTGLIGCFLIVYCDLTGGPERFSAGNGVYTGFFFFGTFKRFGFGAANDDFFFGVVAANEIGLILLIGFEIIGFAFGFIINGFFFGA